jgi:hypothetical protein
MQSISVTGYDLFEECSEEHHEGRNNMLPPVEVQLLIDLMQQKKVLKSNQLDLMK